MTSLEPRIIIGQLAARRRAELGLQLTDFATMVGVHEVWIHTFECGAAINGYRASLIERGLGWVPGISDRIEYEVNLGRLQASDIRMELLDAEDSPYKEDQ